MLESKDIANNIAIVTMVKGRKYNKAVILKADVGDGISNKGFCKRDNQRRINKRGKNMKKRNFCFAAAAPEELK